MRALGLACGLALAVRPAGLAETPGSTARRRRVRPERGREAPLRLEGRPGQCAAFRTRGHDLPGDGATRARLTAWSSRQSAAPSRYGGNRTRPVTGPPGAATRRAAGLPARRARRKLPHRQRRFPGSDCGRLRPVTLAAHLPHRLAAPVSRSSHPGRQARRRGCALETAKKVATSPGGQTGNIEPRARCSLLDSASTVTTY